MGIERAARFRLATSEPLERAVRLAPGAKALAWRAASRYVAGRSREDAGHRCAASRAGTRVSIDLFGERVHDSATADGVVAEYLALAAALPPPPADVWLSVDLSHLALSVDTGAVTERPARSRLRCSSKSKAPGPDDPVVLDVVLDVTPAVARN